MLNKNSFEFVVKDSNHNSFHSVSSGVHSDHISEPVDDKTIVGSCGSPSQTVTELVKIFEETRDT